MRCQADHRDVGRCTWSGQRILDCMRDVRRGSSEDTCLHVFLELNRPGYLADAIIRALDRPKLGEARTGVRLDANVGSNLRRALKTARGLKCRTIALFDQGSHPAIADSVLGRPVCACRETNFNSGCVARERLFNCVCNQLIDDGSDCWHVFKSTKTQSCLLR